MENVVIDPPLSACSDLSIASSPARIRKHHVEAVYSIEPRLDVRSRRVMVRINASMQQVRIVGMRPHGYMPTTLAKEKLGLPRGFQRRGVWQRT